MVRQIFIVIMLSFSISIEAAFASIVAEIEANNSVASAQNIDAFFSLDFSADIGDTTTNTSTTIPHVTITGTGNDTTDFYSFTVGTLQRGIFDIDYGMFDFDPYLNLYSPGGGFMFGSDDASTTFGQGGSVHSFDSYFEFIFTTAGTYYIEVGRYPGGLPIPSGSDYHLQVSIENHSTTAAVPEMGSAFIWAALLGVVGGAITLARKKATRLPD